ncbi:MAG: DMT family transporter [Gammaproteobacteria bacterium]
MLSVSAVFAVLGINAVFAGAYLFGKVGVEHFPPFLFAAMRFALVAVALSPFLRFDRTLFAHRRAAAGFCLTMGIGVYGAMYWALYLADDASAVLIGTQFSTPAAVLLGAWLLQERASRAVWGGIALTMGGVLIVGFDAAALGYPLAFALVLASALFYAAANVISRGLRESGLGILNLNALMALASAPPMLLLSFMFGEPWRAPVSQAGAAEWTTVLYSALAVSLGGHVGLFCLLRRYPLSAVMPFYVFTPIFGVSGAILFLGEMPTLRFAAGAVLAICGIVVVNRFHRRAAAGA